MAISKSCANLIIIVVWMWWTGIMMLNVYLEEVIGRQALLETSEIDNNYDVSIQLYNWLGGLGWTIFGLAPAFFVIDIQGYATVLSCFCGLAFYVTLVTIGFLEPNQSWRQIELAERSVDSGGATLTGCFIATNPLKMEILPNITYYTLVDKEWHVDWNSRQSFSEWGWTYLSAPIVYNGSVTGCKFDPPIYAACISKDASPKGCWLESTGPYINIRKLGQNEYMEASTRNKIPYAGTLRSEYMMEWDSQTWWDTQDYVHRMHNKADDQWRNIGLAWGLVTGAAVVVAIVQTMLDSDFESKGI